MIGWLKSLLVRRKRDDGDVLPVADLLCVRHPDWRLVRDAYLAIHPCCAVCGSRVNVRAHHITPVHVDPSLELDIGNLITLCEGDAVNCHLLFGHRLDWRSWNPMVVDQAREWAAYIKRRPYK